MAKKVAGSGLNFSSLILASKRNQDGIYALFTEKSSHGKSVRLTNSKEILDAAQIRQPIENSLVFCHLKTLRLYTGLFKFELDHYLTNESTYWG